MTYRAPSPAQPERPRKRRGYSWCRLANDFPDLPIWRAVAKRARVPVHQVIVVALRLECLANRSVPRGSVADMSVAEFAASLQLRPDVVARIRTALEEPDISWIDQDFVVDFHQRNPDHDDPTAAERQRRRRLKLKAEREGAAATGPPAAEVVHSHGESRRDSVTVTTDQIRSDSSGSVDNSARALLAASDGQPGSDLAPAGPPSSSEELWLRTEGARIVVERMNVPLTRATLLIERWRRDVDGDAAVMADLLRGLDAAKISGPRFHVVVVDQVRRLAMLKQNGAGLPLPPGLVHTGVDKVADESPPAAEPRMAGHG